MREVRVERVAPVVPVRDLDAALERYRRLGFAVEAYAGPDRYGYVRRGQVQLHLSEDPDHRRRHGAVVYLYVSDADELYAEWQAAGVDGRFHPPEDTAYRMREFGYVDSDGTAHRVGSWQRPLHLEKDGRRWLVGSDHDVEWLASGTTPGLRIVSAIPPVYEAYATVVVPGGAGGALDDHTSALVELLSAQRRRLGDRLVPHTAWWLGYLDTGADDVVFPDAPMVELYSRWRYVFVQAGPDQALAWRTGPFGPLPEVMVPTDRSWLLSRLWDDDWRCLGGPRSLVDAVLADPRLEAREVGIDDADVTPPGHTAV